MVPMPMTTFSLSKAGEFCQHFTCMLVSRAVVAKSRKKDLCSEKGAQQGLGLSSSDAPKTSAFYTSSLPLSFPKGVVVLLSGFTCAHITILI